MRPALRLLTLAAATAAILAIPASGWAAANTPKATDLSGHPLVSAPVAPNAIYAHVPGASVETVGLADAKSLDTAASVLVVHAVSLISYVYPTTGTGAVIAPIHIPAGSTVWQMDYFGYVTTATGQTGWSTCTQVMTLGVACTSNPGTSTAPVAGGLVQGTRTWSSGLVVEQGVSLSVYLDNATPTSGYVGAVVQYTPPAMQLYPIAPLRVYDSRFSAKVGNGERRTISIKDAINVGTGVVSAYDVIPQGARAINFTTTLSQTAGSGNVAVLPGGSTTVTASTINWTTSGLDIAAGSTVTLGTGSNERKITLALGGSAGATSHVIIDITGYYL